MEICATLIITRNYQFNSEYSSLTEN